MMRPPILFPCYDLAGGDAAAVTSAGGSDGGDGSDDDSQPSGVASGGQQQQQQQQQQQLQLQLLPVSEDDSAVRAEPSRHVDYLSHDWFEEDLWTSWRHVVANRRSYGPVSRLENASWRSWAKAKNGLRTVEPARLNWYKDSEVTWLYGPLQTRSHRSSRAPSEPASQHLSKSNSFLGKKPILKKRSTSEIILRKSLSTSSLVRQATAAIQAQQRSRPPPRSPPADDDATPSLRSSKPASREAADSLSSRSTSGLQSPDGRRKHIRFDDTVEQYISVEIKEAGDDDDDDDDDDDSDNDDPHRRFVAAAVIYGKPHNGRSSYSPHNQHQHQHHHHHHQHHRLLHHHHHSYSSSSEDDGLVYMKKMPQRRSSRSRSRSNSFTENRTIAKLPATTLKYRVESPEPVATVATVAVTAAFRSMDAVSGSGGGPPPAPAAGLALLPSLSQETIRPDQATKHFILDDDDDEADYDWNPSPSTPFFGDGDGQPELDPKPDATPDRILFTGKDGSVSVGTTAAARPAGGLCRTASGMFMPYEDDADKDDDAASATILGRVVDTVNTAKDIAHVIWNVGWSKR